MLKPAVKNFSISIADVTKGRNCAASISCSKLTKNFIRPSPLSQEKLAKWLQWIEHASLKLVG